MFSIAICDDKELTCSELEKIVESFDAGNDIKTEVFYSGEELYESLCNGDHYDLIFLDIELKMMNGVIVAQRIREELCDEKIQIVFISGKQEYAMELFEVRPLHFLVKPITKRHVFKTLEKAIKLSNIYFDYFEFQCEKEYHKCHYGDIIFFESKARRIFIHTVKQEYVFYGKLNDVEKQINGAFLRIHQSYLVNPLYIDHYKSDQISILGGKTLPISKAFRVPVRKAILEKRS